MFRHLPKENSVNKPIVVALSLFFLLAAACGSKAEKITLKAGTDAYELAEALAAKMPALAPDKDTIMVESKQFTVTAAEVILTIRNNLGIRADQLKDFDAGQIKEIIERGATQVGERKLLLAAAKKAGTVVPDADFEKELQEEFGRAGSEEAYLQALGQAGVPIEHVKKSMRESMIIDTYLTDLMQEAITVTDEQVMKAYEEDRTASVRHILLLTQGKSDEEKAELRKKMEGLLVRARAGEDFAALAEEFSEDPGSRENGGLYEDFGRGRMVKPFEDASFAVAVGGISDIVETDYGYHIIKVVDRKKEIRPLEEVRAELEAQLKETRENAFVQDHIAALKEKAGFKLIGL
jgi:parvulin-like peptidyl-prolyl isomerase